MQLMTYDEILTKLCDNFDELIAPRTISRSNTNIIYLMFKAIAKGFEVINNVAVTLSNKFNPASCSTEDLESVAKLVGTERFSGSATGLAITITNNSKDEMLTLLAGEYSYALEDEIIFYFTVNQDTEIAIGSFIQVIAITKRMGKFPVTAQATIEVKGKDSDGESIDIPSNLNFSCSDNFSLLGTEAETDLAFRKRILYDTTRQDTITELETKIRNLPYIFDCKIVFNQSPASIVYDDITISPYYMLLMISGDVKPEVAQIIAKSGIYPTVMTDATKYVDYVNRAFAGGYMRIYYSPFGFYDYNVSIIYKADLNYISAETVEGTMRSHLYTVFNTNVHSDIITEQDIYNALESLKISGIRILSVEMSVNSNRVNYLTVPRTRIPRMSSISFREV